MALWKHAVSTLIWRRSRNGALADRVETAVAGLLAAAELHQGDPDGRRPWLALTLPSLFRKP
jgi:hypothetical protein